MSEEFNGSGNQSDQEESWQQDGDGDAGETEIIIKEGTMQKRAIGKTALGRASGNWKERYFRLTGAGLTYYSDRKSSAAKGTIRIEQMQDVKASEAIPTGFDLVHYHVTTNQAILDKELILVCDTGSKYVRDEWIRALKDVIRSWKNMDRRASVKLKSSSTPAEEWEAPETPMIGQVSATNSADVQSAPAASMSATEPENGAADAEDDEDEFTGFD
eukprot:m.870035 g.870035  ORF g.870035 m.870035 type:complete len:216 (-) comp23564_c0_seq56:3026-3673(-)